MIPDQAFILAAGLGTRLRPLTEARPKPMVEVAGKPMIDHALDALAGAGVRRCAVNTHYRAEVLHEHLKGRERPSVIVSHEPDLLDTGGGIRKALHHFDAPFFVLSGDSVWEDAPGESALLTLGRAWDPEIMDILILLQPVETMVLTRGAGDYDLGPDGRAVRSLSKEGSLMFTSIRINRPEIFAGTPEGAFSYLDLLDAAQARGRLYGVQHKGSWHHISTPADLQAVNAAWSGS